MAFPRTEIPRGTRGSALSSGCEATIGNNNITFGSSSRVRSNESLLSWLLVMIISMYVCLFNLEIVRLIARSGQFETLAASQKHGSPCCRCCFYRSAAVARPRQICYCCSFTWTPVAYACYRAFRAVVAPIWNGQKACVQTETQSKRRVKQSMVESNRQLYEFIWRGSSPLLPCKFNKCNSTIIGRTTKRLVYNRFIQSLTKAKATSSIKRTTISNLMASLASSS